MAHVQKPISHTASREEIVPAAPSIAAAPGRLSLVTLIFAILSVTFFLLLVFLRFPFPFNPLMSWQDALDLLTPLALIPVYWLMYRTISQGEKGWFGNQIFIVFAAFWAMGQGMHLSANSINNLIGDLPKSQGLDVSGTEIHTLTYFYDELLSHYLWHIGVLGLAALLMYASWHSPVEEKTDWRWVIPSVVLYGINVFCIFVEGLTTPLSFPFITLTGLIALVWGRKMFARKPVLVIFTLSFLVGSILIGGWSFFNGTFPPPKLMK